MCSNTTQYYIIVEPFNQDTAENEDTSIIRTPFAVRNTVEPLNNGHIRTDHFVHYREVGVSVSVLYTEVSFIRSVLYQRFDCRLSTP